MIEVATAAPGAGPLAALLDSSPDGLVVVDAAGRVIGWNRTILAMSGLAPAAMASATEDTIEAYLTPIDRGERLTAGDAGPTSSSHEVVSASDGRLFERIEQAIDLSDTDTGRMVCYRPLDIASGSTDVDRRKLRSVSEQRRHALRMEAVGRLAGGIAHDFNNMLTVMIGFAEQLKDDVGERESLREIVRAAHRAADLTRQLLAFSRQQVLRPRVVDVASVVTSMGGMVGRLIGDDVRLEIDAPEGLPSVCADPSQLEQIVLNLAINARDAMTHGGRLSIAIRKTVLDAPRPGRAAQPAGEYVQVTISDTGNGIAPELLSKIFEPFFTTKGMHGTGLGLSTVYGIVKQSGGFIWVDSEVGSGTTFTIDLPVTSLPKDSMVTLERTPTTYPQRASERILVVEDLEPVRLVTKEMLEAEGYDVMVAATPNEAISVMERVGDRIDLVLTDVMMPEMTGSSLATALRARRPGLPVLFMSGLPKALDWNEPGSFLAKPFTRAMLISHVRTRLATAMTAA